MFIVPVVATFVTTWVIFFLTSLITDMYISDMYTTNVGFTITVIMYLFQQIQTAEWIEAKKNAEIERKINERKK